MDSLEEAVVLMAAAYDNPDEGLVHAICLGGYLSR